jgi:hypothetical protein
MFGLRLIFVFTLEPVLSALSLSFASFLYLVVALSSRLVLLYICATQESLLKYLRPSSRTTQEACNPAASGPPNLAQSLPNLSDE